MATRGRTNGQKYPDLASGYISEAGVEGHPNARKGETSEPAQNFCGFFSTREAIGLDRW
ncbi:MAG TPA: hypothetical protein VEL11_07505 [Candidatus Bathyarchaeia archaeon]|nr:hypothetical protein [Candidatus Bathyarchaeia archaeon]